MVLREGLHALRAEWVWWWLRNGRLEAIPFLDTKALVVTRNCRLRKTYFRLVRRKPVKFSARYWFGRGVFLVPCWVPLEQVYNPVADKDVEKLSPQELRERRMYLLNDGTIVVLIYQHVDDLLHFRRQQQHIRDQYDLLQREIAYTLETLENEILAWAYKNLFSQRKAKIEEILRRRQPFEEAGKVYSGSLSERLRLWHDQVLGILSSKQGESFINGVSVLLEGMKNYINRLQTEFDSIDVRPVRRFLSLSRRRLQEAIAALETNNPTGFKRGMELAAKHLQRAQEALRQSEETEPAKLRKVA